ncbi:MAG: DNA repair protein RadC [Caldisericia bacterium]|nr:DNA repair protein RadC [Caldisericia bacterium]
MPLFHDIEDVTDFLALKRVYPRWSKKNQCFFSKKIDILTKEEEQSIWDLLHIHNEVECALIREKIRQKIIHLYPFNPIVNWQIRERPRERLLEKGPESLSDSQLLAVILRTGTQGCSAQDLARELLIRFGSFRSLYQASTEELRQFHGLGPAKIAQLKAAMEIGRRVSGEVVSKKPKLINPDKVKHFVEHTLQWNLRDAKKEMFAIVFLDTKLKPLSHYISTIGSNKESVVDIPDIIRRSTLANASAIVLIHNHPSGETEPSPEDIDSTRRIIQACQLVGIMVVDHIIIGANPDDLFSFAGHKII